MVTLQLVHALVSARQFERADVVEAAGLACFLFQLGINAETVVVEVGGIGTAAEGPCSTGRMPGRTCREFGALDQDHIVEARLHQVVGDGTAGDATTNDRHFHMLLHQKASAMRLWSVPMPSISTSTMFPGFKKRAGL